MVVASRQWVVLFGYSQGMSLNWAFTCCDCWTQANALRRTERWTAVQRRVVHEQQAGVEGGRLGSDGWAIPQGADKWSAVLCLRVTPPGPGCSGRGEPCGRWGRTVPVTSAVRPHSGALPRARRRRAVRFRSARLCRGCRGALQDHGEPDARVHVVGGRDPGFDEGGCDDRDSRGQGFDDPCSRFREADVLADALFNRRREGWFRRRRGCAVPTGRRGTWLPRGHVTDEVPAAASRTDGNPRRW
jgi:hypothetical protein